MATEDPIWGEQGAAGERKLKLGIRFSPRTVRKYPQDGGPRREPRPKQRRLSFVRNHAKVIVACNFLVKTGRRLMRHARYCWLLLAESHLTRRLFGAMVRRIAALPVPAG